MAFVCASLAAGGSEVYGGGPGDSALREKDARKGERIVAQLRRLERLSATDVQGERALANKLYPGLFVKVSELGDGDLKTDLTTAVFLYEQALRESEGAGGVAVDCAAELRSVYGRVCAEEESRTPPKFLRAKARLHTDWAEALIKAHEGAGDAATSAALEEMRAERRNDLALAQKAVAALKALGQEVHVYSSLAEFQEHRAALARVPFERLSEDAASALREVDRILQSLPRGPLFYPLYHARNFYSDGLFWWRKTYRRRQVVVDANSFGGRDGDAESLGLDPDAVDYTVSINWRNAAKRIRRAEQLIAAAKTR
ncbi:MAG TPA: hypothetical protein VN256_27515 [Pyrinomonadaceae bacterium]|nr:hypothetical protein [Pyrinomonadaceae bacterium]